MEDPPAAEPDVTDLLVPAGTRVQSQPGPEETAQVFETLADLDARVAWNTLRPRLTRPVTPGSGDVSTWVAGTPALQVGDALLFAGRERWDVNLAGGFDADTNRWDFRRVTAVEPSLDGQRTRIAWSEGLNGVADPGGQATAGLKLFQLRDRASLFGYNAPHPLSLTERQRDAYGYADDPPDNSPSPISGTDEQSGDWFFQFPGDQAIDLDNLYKSFVAGGWIVLHGAMSLPQPYRITNSLDGSLAKYAISGKAQRLSLDTGGNLNFYLAAYRDTTVSGGSVELAFTDTPVSDWVAGSAIELDTRADDLPEGRRLIVRGRRARLRCTAQSHTLIHDDGAARAILLDDIVTLLDEPEPGSDELRFRLDDGTGFVGTVVAPEDDFEPVPAPESAPEIVVAATLDQVVAVDSGHSRLDLADSLGVAFDRASLRIHANVARAAHGEGASEILGGGDPSVPFQKFLLKQAPVTHRLAGTETGVESTLSVRIDGVEWDEVPDLYQRGATARVYKTSLTDDGETVVEFGDGVSGARPPPGRDNIVANHSRGLGLAGNLRAGQLTLPLDRPLGLKSTGNPLPATGGDDPERAGDARRNAPIYTLTLGRVVSLTDYRDFALGFPGIAKAEARWVWQGETRRIVVTVAGQGGTTPQPGSATYDNLLDAFRSLGDPLVGVDLLAYAPATFRLGLRVAVEPAYDNDAVLAATETALRAAFAFDARDFGAVLSLSEVAAVAHGVDGLAAVDIDQLYRTVPPQTAVKAHARLISRPGRLGSDGLLKPGEILTLDPRPLDTLVLMA